MIFLHPGFDVKKTYKLFLITMQRLKTGPRRSPTSGFAPGHPKRNAYRWRRFGPVRRGFFDLEGRFLLDLGLCSPNFYGRQVLVVGQSCDFFNKDGLEGLKPEVLQKTVIF